MFYTNWWLRGKTLHLKYVNSQGIRQRETHVVSPTLYVHAKPKGVENTEHRDIHGKPVFPIEFSTPKDARDFVEYYKDTTSFKIFGFNRFDYTVINEIFPGKVQYDFTQINIGYIDIETEIGETFASADDPHQRINAISMHYNGKLHTWSLYDVKDSYFCKSEKQLLETFLTHWKIADLDIISGWNSQGFDMPYIAKRIELVLGEGREHDLSPFPGGVSYRQVETKYGQLQTQVSIAGVAQLDLLELYRKFVLQKQETYKLDFIAQKDLGVGKLEFDGTLKDLYEGTYEVRERPDDSDEFSKLSYQRYLISEELRKRGISV